VHTGATTGPHVMVAVSDTGAGMDAKTMAHIFEPFFTTKERGHGTGLGLATVYGIVKQSGGSIWAYSEPGQGATFKVYLPRGGEAVAQAGQAMKDAKSTRGSETVLVVEDEEGVRSLVCNTLAGQGYKVLESDGPMGAASTMQRHAKPIHMLLTDVVMPQMSGKELADRMSVHHPEARVLFMSGYTDDAVVRHGILEANTFFLQKPFTLNALVQKVREVLDADRPTAQQ
jgi:two-component system cell cycle sensor histidine kinase/response regulator CckA